MSDSPITLTLVDVETVGRPIDFATLDTLAERDALGAEELEAGIFVYVNENETLYYRSTDNTTWIVFLADTTGAIADVVSDVSDLTTALGDYQPLDEKSAANGYASLDSSGLVPLAELPPLGDFRIAATIAERDALVVDAGTWVRVLSMPYVYEKTASSWRVVARPGDVAAYAALNAGGYYHVYVSAAGNDETGNGSLATPWRDVQRALDGIPDNVRGWYEIHTVGAGPFHLPLVPRYAPNGALVIQIVGDTQAAASVSWDAGAVVGSRPVDGGITQAGVFEYNVGAYVGSLTDGSHWVEINAPVGVGPADFVTYAALVDGAASVSPLLRVPSPYNRELSAGFFGCTARLRAYVSIMDAPGDYPAYGSMTNDNDDPNVSVSLIGIKFLQMGSLTLKHVSSQALCFDESFVFLSDNAGQSIEYVAITASEVVVGDANNTGINVLSGAGCLGCISSAIRETFLSGVIRGRDADGISWYFGGITAGRAKNFCSVEVEGLDLMSTEGAVGYVFRGANIRMGNHAPHTVQGNVTQWFSATAGSFVAVVNCTGEVVGTPAAVSEASVLLSGWPDCNVVNLLGTGEDVSVNGIVVSFASLADGGCQAGQPLNLTLVTPSNAPTTFVTIPLIANTARDVLLEFTCTSAAGAALLQRRFLCSRIGALAVVAADAAITDTDLSLGGSVSIAGNVAVGAIDVDVTGLNGAAVRWVARVSTSYVLAAS